jgi:hypothetical protein
VDQDQDLDLCYACVFGDLKSLCKDRIEREASQAYPKRASLLLPCVALRSALLLPAVAKLFLLRRCSAQLSNLLLHQVRFVPHSSTLCMPQALGTGSGCYGAPELVITQKKPLRD